jgi:hypothetical protein
MDLCYGQKSGGCGKATWLMSLKRGCQRDYRLRRQQRTHLIDDKTVAKIGHPDDLDVGHPSVQSRGCAKVARRISSTGSIRVLSIETPALLENERDKGLNFVAILQVFFAEVLHHETLFSPGLQPVGKREE